MSWEEEFGPEHEPPKLLKKWAERTKLDDFSWHNDEAPKYAFDHETGYLAFWFDMTEIANQRYGVVFYPEDGGYVDILQRTGDIDGAIAAFEEARERIEGGEVFREETHQPAPPPPPHEWSPRNDS